LAQGDSTLVEPLVEDRDPGVRAGLAECLVRVRHPRGDFLLERLQRDAHPHVRAAALTPAAASELVKDPDRDTSWHVLAKAARLAQVPLWQMAPDPPWKPAAEPSTIAEPLQPQRAAPVHPRLLGPDALPVSPVGISGHYGLPVEGFVRAVEAGVNLLFWEP